MSQNWKNRRVFVTGSAGFIGGWLTERLIEAGADVTCFVLDQPKESRFISEGMSKKVKVIEGTLADFDVLEKAMKAAKPEYVFHLAAQALVGVALKDPLETFESNIRGTYNLLEVCRRHFASIPIIVASSDKAYGDSKVLPYTEDLPLHGMHPYDVSKSCTDLLALTYAHTYCLPITVARFGNVYGGGDMHLSRIVPGTILSVLNGETPIIRSDGTPKRDYVYVMDVVDGYIALAENIEKTKGEAFNFGPKRPLSVLEVVTEITKAMGKNVSPKILNEAKFEIQDQYLASDKAKKVLGWAPKVSFEDGIKKTIDWYTNNRA